MPSLAEIHAGQRGRIDLIDGPPEVAQRLMEFGLIEGEIVEIIGFAPMGDPIEILIGDSRLSLRKREAAHITLSLL